jgi:beta-1,4-mannosyltransferase
MPEFCQQPKKTVISLLPVATPDNRFIEMFSQAISEQGFTVRGFRWRSLGLQRTKVVFLHWPNEFFINEGKGKFLKSLIKLAVIRVAKVLWSTKFVWVAHNAAPHEGANSDSILRRRFLGSLDGIVYFSDYSRGLINNLYPQTGKCKALVTVHGHYRGGSTTRETPRTVPSENIKLVHFGLIRPYKNVDQLVDVVSSISSGFRLLVAGMITDNRLCAAIKERSRASSHIVLDFRDTTINDSELEAIVDSADAVVLPYKKILNSGAALFSLSRSRPVLAPNIGSLPELRDQVGREWVYLYDGGFTQEVLADFKKWMLRTTRAMFAPLDAYEWNRVGSDLRGFIESLTR